MIDTYDNQSGALTPEEQEWEREEQERLEREREEWRKLMTCPNCGRVDRREYIYGFPNDEDFERAAKGEVRLMGCSMPDGITPTPMKCPDCGHEWEIPV